MRRLVRVLLFISLAGLAFGQGHPNVPWSLGGFGSVLYPAMGHAPTATPPIGQFNGGGFSHVNGGGFSHGFANPGRTAHPQHGSSVIVPYPVYYGGYYDPSAGYGNGYGQGYGSGYTDDGSQGGQGLPSVVINQNFVPPQANPQVRDYYGRSVAAATGPIVGTEVVPGTAFASLCRCRDRSSARTAASDQPTIYLIALRDHYHRSGAGLLDGRQHPALRECGACAESAQYRFSGSRSVAAFE